LLPLIQRFAKPLFLSRSLGYLENGILHSRLEELSGALEARGLFS
jgi:hypothetical protein